MGEPTSAERWAAAEAKADALENSKQPDSVAETVNDDGLGAGSEDGDDGDAGSASAGVDDDGDGAAAKDGGATDDEGSEESGDDGDTKKADADSDGKPTPKERVGFRAWKRKELAKIAATRETAQQELVQIRQKLQTEFGPLEAARKALADGDLDALAASLGKAGGLGELTDWASLNKYAISRFSSPEYMEIQKLKRESRERRQHDEQVAADNERQQQTVAQQQAEQRYLAKLTDDLFKMGGPAAAMSEEPAFTNAVYSVLKAHYDPATQDSVTLEEAAEEVLASVRKVHKFHSKALGGQTSPGTKSEIQPPGAPNKGRPAKRSKTISTARSVEGSASGPPKTREDWLKKWGGKMHEASG